MLPSPMDNDQGLKDGMVGGVRSGQGSELRLEKVEKIEKVELGLKGLGPRMHGVKGVKMARKAVEVGVQFLVGEVYKSMAKWWLRCGLL